MKAQVNVIIAGADHIKPARWKQWIEANYRLDCDMITSDDDSLPGMLKEYQTTEPAKAWVCLGTHCLVPVHSSNSKGGER